MYIVSNHITIDAIIAIPTISCALPVNVNHAMKKPRMVKICAIDSFIASIIHLPTNFNNAGILGSVGPIKDISSEGWHRTIDVLLSSVFFGINERLHTLVV